MTGLFADLSQAGGRGLAQSLRQSQLASSPMRATAHPFHWAAFTIIGDGAAAVEMSAGPVARKDGERGRHEMAANRLPRGCSPPSFSRRPWPRPKTWWWSRARGIGLRAGDEDRLDQAARAAERAST